MPAFLPSELPIRASVRHHWIVMFRKPPLFFTVVLLILLAAAVFQPWPMTAPFALLFGSFAFLRWQKWNAETVILTRLRVVRVRGVPETTTTESSLRLDRISGAVLEQTVLGKLLNFGTIELEAPGNHPDFRKLVKIEHPREFYMKLRLAIFGENVAPDPDDDPQEYVTAPLPLVRPPVRRRR